MTDRILVVEDTLSLAMLYKGQLEKAGFSVDVAGSRAEAHEAVAARDYQVVLLDLQLPDGDGMGLAYEHGQEGRPGAIIVITSDASVARAVEAMRHGAYDFLVKPFAEQRLITSVRNAAAHQTLKRTVDALEREAPKRDFMGFIGSSAGMQVVYRAIENVARSKAAVFITGESGTGKEVCAEAIHKAGPRAKGPFVPLNCGAIPSELIESEIFGHLKGSFTGAIADRAGAAALAHSGTLFLDEICEMDVGLQTKLLRFLQTGLIQPVGSGRQQPVDVRVICATNRDPVAEMQAGRFREDLFYRLNVLPIHLPPLRDRGEDVIRIAQVFLRRFAAEEGKGFCAFDAGALARLHAHAWPGNVRELQNVIRQIVVLNDGDTVTEAMFPCATDAAPRAAQPAPGAQSVAIGRPLRQIERDAIEATLRLVDGSIPKAAKILDVSPSTLYRKMEAWRETA
ncbi:MAG: sigma-54-dependent transcriptional regulator [Rhodothalassiaceae bacterium]